MSRVVSKATGDNDPKAQQKAKSADGGVCKLDDKDPDASIEVGADGTMKVRNHQGTRTIRMSADGKALSRAETEELIQDMNEYKHSGKYTQRGHDRMKKLHFSPVETVVGWVPHATVKLGCAAKKVLWDKSLSKVVDQFKPGHRVHMATVDFLSDLLWDSTLSHAFGKKSKGFWKGLGRGFKSALCFSGKYIVPVRQISKGVRNSWERAQLVYLLERDPTTVGQVLAEAEKAGWISKEEGKDFLEEFTKTGQVRKLWQEAKEMPRKHKGSFCSKGTGEAGSPGLDEAIATGVYKKDSKAGISAGQEALRAYNAELAK